MPFAKMSKFYCIKLTQYQLGYVIHMLDYVLIDLAHIVIVEVTFCHLQKWANFTIESWPQYQSITWWLKGRTNFMIDLDLLETS